MSEMNTLTRSATPNMAYTDNPVYWNKYERATLSEKCVNCAEPFIPSVEGQQFCSKKCYIPPCSACNEELAFLNGDQPKTLGMPLCAGCYWEAEEDLRKERVLASKNAASGGKYTEEEIAKMEDEALEKMYNDEQTFQDLKAELEDALNEARHSNCDYD